MLNQVNGLRRLCVKSIMYSLLLDLGCSYG